MKLHTDKITLGDLHAATVGIDGVWVEATQHGSRSRARAFDLHLVADERKGRRRSNNGHYGAGTDYAATWDEWGIVFARLFAIDPGMTCYAYGGADAYHWQTGGRFRTENFKSHDQHRWTYNPEATEALGPPFSESRCKCGAVRRFAWPEGRAS